MEKSKILYVTQEINPFLIQSEISNLVRTLSQGVHETDKEIRIFMPRFGVINERRHQLHEVIRLSGMNLIINDYDHPLIIKVASIPQIRIKVIYSIYDVQNKNKFSKNFKEKLAFDEIPVDELNIEENMDVKTLHRIGLEWCDAIGVCSSDAEDHFKTYLTETDKPLLQFHSEEQTIEVHQDFYEKVLSESGVLA